ncbi:MAG: Ig-like domain-containing protein, partial [Candidatus Paceibacterota bacterium]
MRSIARATLVALAIYASALTLACSGGDSSGPGPVTPPPTVTLSTISVSGQTPMTANPNAMTQFVANGKYSDGSTQSLSSATWKSSDETVATVSGGGGVTAIKAGSFVISATASGVTGSM